MVLRICAPRRRLGCGDGWRRRVAELIFHSTPVVACRSRPQGPMRQRRCGPRSRLTASGCEWSAPKHRIPWTSSGRPGPCRHLPQFPDCMEKSRSGAYGAQPRQTGIWQRKRWYAVGWAIGYLQGRERQQACSTCAERSIIAVLCRYHYIGLTGLGIIAILGYSDEEVLRTVSPVTNEAGKGDRHHERSTPISFSQHPEPVRFEPV